MAENPRTPEENQQEFDKLSEATKRYFVEVIHAEALAENLSHEEIFNKKILVEIEDLIPDIKPYIEDDKYQSEQYGLDDQQNFSIDFEREMKRAPLYSAFEKREDIPFPFKGQIVVDLGCGDTPWGYMAAWVAGAKGYIGVDKFVGDELKDKLGNKEELARFFTMAGYAEDYYRNPGSSRLGKGELPLIPGVTSNEDMLEFLKRLPDRSVSVITCGHAYIILDDKYKDEIRQEIERVISDDGYCANYESGLSPKSDDFERDSTSIIDFYRRKKNIK